MKIAIDVTPIVPGGENGGAKQLLFELIKGLAKKSKGEEYVLLTTKENVSIFKEFEKMGVRTICVGSSPQAKTSGSNGSSSYDLFFFVIKFFKRAFRYLILKKINYYLPRGMLKREKISVLFFPLTAPNFARRWISNVCVIHDLQHSFYPQFFDSNQLAVRNRFYSELAGKADHVITVSSFTKKTVMERLGIPSEKITPILSAVHQRLEPSSEEDKNRILSQYGLAGLKYFYYPANFWFHKNHSVSLIAFNMFLKKYPEHDVHLVFSGALLEKNTQIQKAIKRMGLERRIHALDYVPDNHISAVWSGAYSLVFPSFFEGFGIPAIEAMHFGKPILCSNVSSLPEVCGDAALYFNPYSPDQIVEAFKIILTDKNLYHSLVERGRKRLEFFEYERMVEQYRNVLIKAAKEN